MWVTAVVASHLRVMEDVQQRLGWESGEETEISLALDSLEE